MVKASVLFEITTYDDDDFFVYLRLFYPVFFVEQLEGLLEGHEVCSSSSSTKPSDLLG